MATSDRATMLTGAECSGRAARVVSTWIGQALSPSAVFLSLPAPERFKSQVVAPFQPFDVLEVRIFVVNSRVHPHVDSGSFQHFCWKSASGGTPGVFDSASFNSGVDSLQLPAKACCTTFFSIPNLCLAICFHLHALHLG